MILKTEAIVLKTFDLRETSRIAIFFSKNYGKIKGVLKGIRKDPKKFGSNVDKFTINDVVYYQYSRSDLHLISHCDIKQYFFQIRQDYKRNIAANYMLELVDSVMPVEQANRKVYQLILDYLNTLESVKDIDTLVHILQIKMLALSGFKPHFDSCVKCQKKVTGRVRFSLKSGGLVCPECPTRETAIAFISRGAISSLLHIEQSDWSTCLRLRLTQPVQKELKYILNNFLVYHLEKRLRAAKYL